MSASSMYSARSTDPLGRWTGGSQVNACAVSEAKTRCDLHGVEWHGARICTVSGAKLWEMCDSRMKASAARGPD